MIQHAQVQHKCHLRSVYIEERRVSVTYCTYTSDLRCSGTIHVRHCNTSQQAATHCNTLQHTATHCNILQHSAGCTWLPGGAGAHSQFAEEGTATARAPSRDRGGVGGGGREMGLQNGGVDDWYVCTCMCVCVCVSVCVCLCVCM